MASTQYFTKKVITPTSLPSKIYPSEFANCKISVTMKNTLSDFWKHDSNFETNGNQLEMCIGKSATPFNIVIDQCLTTVSEGELCEVLIKADGSKFCESHVNTNAEKIAVKDDHEEEKSVDSASPKKARCLEDSSNEPQIIRVNLRLDDITKQGKNIHELSDEEKLDIAKELKSNGASLFKHNVEFSFLLFGRALKYCLCVGEDVNIQQDLKERVQLIKTQCYLNLSACQLQKGSYNFVVQNCTKALRMDPSNIKGLYRRAQALVKTARYEEARIDLEKALDIEPNNKSMQNMLTTALQQRHQQEQKLATAMSKMFK